NRFAIIETGGLGYKVYISPIVLSKFKPGEAVDLFTHLQVRDDAMELYGFLAQAELDFFNQLIEISGVGPKTALNVLALAKVDDIKRAISCGDATILTKVSGIGRKTAERIILELKNKFADLSVSGDGGADIEVIDALVGLGYKVNEAREAIKNLPANIEGVQERIREALKNIQ
ncbi:MAG: Holliday junction branch migration protein RuvA, partial [bacterium]